MTENRDLVPLATAWWIGDVLHIGEPHLETVNPAPPEPMRETLRARLAELKVDPSELSFPYPVTSTGSTT
jgi:hypothetical protein